MKTNTLKSILIFFAFITMFLNIKVLATTGPNLPLSKIRSQHELFRRVAEGGLSDRQKITLDGKEFLVTFVSARHQLAQLEQRGMGGENKLFDEFLDNTHHNHVQLTKRVIKRILTDGSTGIKAQYDYHIVNGLETNLLQIIFQSYDPEAE